MTKFKDLKKGEILSEAQYYTVGKVVGNEVQLDNEGGSIIVDKAYAEKYLSSADQFKTEEKLNQTELINIVLNNPNKAMTIYFRKADKLKTKKALKSEIEVRGAELQKDFMSRGSIALEEALVNPVLNYIPGDMREIKGYFVGSQDDRGRFQFMDMELDDRGNKNVIKGVDSRTVQSVTVGGTKYILK